MNFASGGLLLASTAWTSSDFWLQVLVWFCLGSTAAGAVASTRTAWVRSRPLGKFVAYAVVAHVGLLALAYATHLNYHPGGYGNGYGVVSIHLRGDGDEVEDADDLAMANLVRESQIDAPPMLEAEDDAPPTTPTMVAPDLLQAAAPLAGAVTMERPVPPLMEKPANREQSSVPPAPIDPLATAELQGDQTNSGNSDESSSEKNIAATESGEPSATAEATPEADVNAPTESRVVSDRQIATQQPIPVVYRNRVSADRSLFALQFGGGADTEAAVKSALDWLAANQSEDGRWDADSFGAGQEIRINGHDRGGAGAHADTGISGLALLAFLGAGHSHLQGDYKETVQHGLEFLLRSQSAEGSFAGQAEFFASMYCHGMGLLALCEAYALTGDPRIKPYVERGVAYTIAAQHPESGGWRYQKGDLGDMSQFGWQVLALESAKSGGLNIPDKTLTGMRRFLESVSSGRQQGLASYRPGERPSPTMTAEAIVCRVFMDQYRPAHGSEAAEFLRGNLPRASHESLYYWYYGTLAMFQVQGRDWEVWNEALKKQLLTRQRRGGKLGGSWDPDAQWGQYGGRVFSTALGALCLEVYYRYLPIYQVADRRRDGLQETTTKTR